MNRLRTEILAVVMFFGPPLLIFRLMGVSLAPVILMIVIYPILRLSQFLRSRYSLRNKEIEDEQRNRRNLY